jgi:hypothetical protein
LDETFIINTKFIRKRLAKIERNKSIGPDGVPGEILKLSGEARTPYIARQLEISLKMLPSQVTGKKPQWFLFTKVLIHRQAQNIAP